MTDEKGLGITSKEGLDRGFDAPERIIQYLDDRYPYIREMGPRGIEEIVAQNHALADDVRVHIGARSLALGLAKRKISSYGELPGIRLVNPSTQAVYFADRRALFGSLKILTSSSPEASVLCDLYEKYPISFDNSDIRVLMGDTQIESLSPEELGEDWRARLDRHFGAGDNTLRFFYDEHAFGNIFGVERGLREFRITDLGEMYKVQAYRWPYSSWSEEPPIPAPHLGEFYVHSTQAHLGSEQTGFYIQSGTRTADVAIAMSKLAIGIYQGTEAMNGRGEGCVAPKALKSYARTLARSIEKSVNDLGERRDVRHFSSDKGLFFGRVAMTGVTDYSFDCQLFRDYDRMLFRITPGQDTLPAQLPLAHIALAKATQQFSSSETESAPFWSRARIMY